MTPTIRLPPVVVWQESDHIIGVDANPVRAAEEQLILAGFSEVQMPCRGWRRPARLVAHATG